MTHPPSSLRPDGIHKGLVARSGSIRTTLDLQPLLTLPSDLRTMPKGSLATPPAKSARKAHIPRLNLQNLAKSIPAKDLAEGLTHLAQDVPPASAPTRDEPQHWTWYNGLRALEVVLLGASGGDAATAKGLLAELCDKVRFKSGGGGVEGVVCDRLREMVGDLSTENHPDAHTLRLSLLAAVSDSDDVARFNNQVGDI